MRNYGLKSTAVYETCHSFFFFNEGLIKITSPIPLMKKIKIPEQKGAKICHTPYSESYSSNIERIDFEMSQRLGL